MNGIHTGNDVNVTESIFPARFILMGIANTPALEWQALSNESAPQPSLRPAHQRIATLRLDHVMF